MNACCCDHWHHGELLDDDEIGIIVAGQCLVKMAEMIKNMSL